MSQRSHQEVFPPTAEDASRRQEIEIPSEEPSENTQAFAADDETWELKDYPSIWQLDDCPDLVFPCARRHVPVSGDWRNALLERRRNYDEEFLGFGTGRCFPIKQLFAAVTAPRSTAKSAKHAREGMLRGLVVLHPQLYPRDLVDLLKIRYKRGVRALQRQNPNATAPETYMHNQDVDQDEKNQVDEKSMAEAQDENGDITIPDVPEPMDDLDESDYSYLASYLARMGMATKESCFGSALNMLDESFEREHRVMAERRARKRAEIVAAMIRQRLKLSPGLGFQELGDYPEVVADIDLAYMLAYGGLGQNQDDTWATSGCYLLPWMYGRPWQFALYHDLLDTPGEPTGTAERDDFRYMLSQTWVLQMHLGSSTALEEGSYIGALLGELLDLLDQHECSFRRSGGSVTAA
ncbi:hypothetical protein QBC37DRAFT_375026 [Rhypophila decipiens]|uniref:Uncharacterized protein n=1 Tax=Rhypophila decipiens TaxID=261697 RepID=A0AAN7B8Y4_9PEZI|nr:hypothetical protein QBC37DRAFT_375026 [Rhypophila decipiens]